MSEEKGMTFFHEIGKELGNLSEAEQAELKQFMDAGMAEEMKGLPLNFPRLTIVHQGIAQFRNDTTQEMVKAFNGVIVHVEQQRVWWKNKFGQGPKEEKGGLPQCFSRDLEAPDRESSAPQSQKCATCAKSQWGSDMRPDGSPAKGQACKEVRRLFVIMEGHLNPYWFAVPPSSLRAISNYFNVLRDKRLGRPQGVVTRFALKNVQNPDGIDYSELDLSYVGQLPAGFIMSAINAKKEIEKVVRVAAPLSASEYNSGSKQEDAA